MKIPIGMEDGQDNLIAQKVKGAYPDCFIGATLFRGDLSIHIEKSAILPICRFLHDDPEIDFDYLIHITSVDNPSVAARFEVVYELFSIRKKHQVRMKARLSESDCEIDSVTSIWKGAEFLEREVYDMMGIRFHGHPNLKRILLPDEYCEGYPLRKDFPVEGRGWRDTFAFLDT
jgi:NADH-quinone oxidoreductase subunit C